MKNTVLASVYLLFVYVPFILLVVCLMTNAAPEDVVTGLSLWSGFGIVLATPLLIIQLYRNGISQK